MAIGFLERTRSRAVQNGRYAGRRVVTGVGVQRYAMLADGGIEELRTASSQRLRQLLGTGQWHQRQREQDATDLHVDSGRAPRGAFDQRTQFRLRGGG